MNSRRSTIPSCWSIPVHDITRKIKGWDPNHLVTTGMIAPRHAWMEGKEHLRKTLYDVPWLDFITNHAYHGDDDPNTNLDQQNKATSREDDSDLAQGLNKPLLIEEAGFEATESRRNRTHLYAKELAVLLDACRHRLHPMGLHGRP